MKHTLFTPKAVPTLSFVLQNGVGVVVEGGNVAKDISDAIVVPTGVVFDQVHNYGGLSFKHEWKTKYNSSVPFSTGFAELSGGRQLDCKKVYVIAPANFNSSTSVSQNEANISTVVEKVLMAANQAHMASISIPTIGTGKLGYSNVVSAGALAKAINAFSSKVSQPNIKSIKVAVFDKDRLGDFQQKLSQDCKAQTPSLPLSSSTAAPSVNSPSVNSPSVNSPSFQHQQMDEDNDGIVPEYPDSVNILIVGEHQRNCDQAMLHLTRKIEEFCVTKQLKTVVPDDMVNVVKKEAGKRDVCVMVTLEDDKPKLTLAGMKEDVSEVTDVVTYHMSEVQERHANLQGQKEMMSQVQWLYEEGLETFEPYPPDAVVILEKAYQSKQMTVQLDIASLNRKCLVCIDKNQEVDQVTGQTRVIKRQKLQTTGT